MIYSTRTSHYRLSPPLSAPPLLHISAARLAHTPKEHAHSTHADTNRG